jgi:membrane associated rhomboid family serine protease
MPRQERFPDLATFAAILGGFVVLIWVIVAADTFLFRHHLGELGGIHPWHFRGLLGIFFAPFLHVNFAHALSNTGPFLILGGLTLARGVREFYVVSGLIILVGGLGTWTFSPDDSIHLGASGLVFGYFGYLIMRAWYDGRFVSGLIALFVVLGYGGMIWGIRPFQIGISWEGHLFGLCGGIAAASRWAHDK